MINLLTKKLKEFPGGPIYPTVLIKSPCTETSNLILKIYETCKVMDPIIISNTIKSPKMTIVRPVMKFITTYQ